MEKQLPKNWVEVQLIDVLEVLENGSRPKGGVQGILEGVPSLGGEHLNSNGSFKLGNLKYVPTSFAEKMNRGRIKQNDILIVKDGATTGKTSFVGSDFPFDLAFVNEHVFICRTFPNLNSKSIFYFLFSKIGFDRIMDNFTGSAQGGINQKFASNTIIPLPPLPEQNRIVTKLDSLFAQLETIKSSMANVPLLLKDFRQQVLTQAVTGKLTEEWRKGKKLESGEAVVKKLKTKKVELITKKKLKAVEAKTSDINDNLGTLPLNWAKTELVNVARIIDPNPSHRMPEYFENGIPFISTENIVNNEINFNKGKKVGTSTLNDQIKRFAINQNDFLFTRIGTIGKSCYLPTTRDYAISHAVCVVGSFDVNLIDPNYLKLIISSRKIIEQGLHGVKSVGVPDLGMGKVRAFIIPITSVQEQQEIVTRVESLFNKADALEKQYESLKAKIDNLPQALLHKAFKGELTEQLASDGDARELLKEIEALKAASGKTLKNKTNSSANKKVKSYLEEVNDLGMVAEANNI